MRWEPPEKFHATITFIGDTVDPAIGKIVSAMQGIAAAHTQFDLTYSKIGCFPTMHRPRVVWIGVETVPETLVTLKQELDTALSSFDIVIEDRPFQPHVTLGRVNNMSGRNGLHRLISTMESLNLKPLGCRVIGIHLIESRLLPRGSEYISLATCILQKH